MSTQVHTPTAFPKNIPKALGQSASPGTPIMAGGWMPLSPARQDFDAPLPEDRRVSYGVTSPVFKQRVHDQAVDARRFALMSPPASPAAHPVDCPVALPAGKSSDECGTTSSDGKSRGQSTHSSSMLEQTLVSEHKGKHARSPHGPLIPVQIAGAVARVQINGATRACDLVCELAQSHAPLVVEALKQQFCGNCNASSSNSQAADIDELAANHIQLWACESSIERPIRAHERIIDVARTWFHADGAHLRLAFLNCGEHEDNNENNSSSIQVPPPNVSLAPLTTVAHYFVPHTRQWRWQQVSVHINRSQLRVASPHSELRWDAADLDVCAVTTVRGWRSDAPGAYVLAVRCQLPASMFTNRQDAVFCLCFNTQAEFDSALALLYATRSHALASRALPIAHTFAALRRALYFNAFKVVPRQDPQRYDTAFSKSAKT